MERDKIRIIEFGMDAEDPSRPAPAGGGSSRTRHGGADPAGSRPGRASAAPGAPAQMKILEFDGGEAQRGPRREATAPELAHIKIVEFDGGEPRPERVSRPAPARASSRSRVRVGPIKIREFGEEHDPRSRGGSAKAPKIKIMEFD